MHRARGHTSYQYIDLTHTAPRSQTSCLMDWKRRRITSELDFALFRPHQVKQQFITTVSPVAVTIARVWLVAYIKSMCPCAQHRLDARMWLFSNGSPVPLYDILLFACIGTHTRSESYTARAHTLISIHTLAHTHSGHRHHA